MFAFHVTEAVAVAAGVGFVVGAFTPAVGRKIKAFFVKETQAAEAKLKAEVTTAAADVIKKA
jgi:hypothetical protein